MLRAIYAIVLKLLVGCNAVVLSFLLCSCGSDTQRTAPSRETEDASASPDASNVVADGGKADAARGNEVEAGSDASAAGDSGDAAGAPAAGMGGGAAAGAAGVAGTGGGGAAAGTGAAGTPAAGGGGGASGAGGAAGGAGGPASVCAPGSTRACYSGPSGTRDVGICRAGVETCKSDGTGYAACSGEVLPANAENCATAVDDDCDGVAIEADAGCLCAPASNRPCYDGPANTRDVGMCRSGTQTCAADGKSFGGCQNQLLPAAENCSTAADDDCSGVPNDTCACQPGEVRACYSAPVATQNIGPCRGGQQTCNAAGSGFGPCVGEVVPQPETCNTAADDDCDGATNESGAGCACQPNNSGACYSGPAGTQNVGICAGGTRTCNAQGTGFGTCTGELLPAASENCNTSSDDSNGQVNEGCTTSVNYAADVQPILQTRCAPCHTVSGSGGANFATQYAGTQLPSYYCSGMTKGACMLVRIQNGTMPAGGACSGNPTTDAGNPACLTAAQQATIQAWIAGGQQP
jgi:hypothetical protein